MVNLEVFCTTLFIFQVSLIGSALPTFYSFSLSFSESASDYKLIKFKNNDTGIKKKKKKKKLSIGWYW
jgi:adenosine/AMP kinase